MENFNYYTPTKVVFGKGTEEQTGELVRLQGCRKVLVHYGSGSAKRSGLLDRIYGALDQAGIDTFPWEVWCQTPGCLLCMKGSGSVRKKAWTLSSQLAAAV